MSPLAYAIGHITDVIRVASPRITLRLYAIAGLATGARVSGANRNGLRQRPAAAAERASPASGPRRRRAACGGLLLPAQSAARPSWAANCIRRRGHSVRAMPAGQRQCPAALRPCLRRWLRPAGGKVRACGRGEPLRRGRPHRPPSVKGKMYRTGAALDSRVPVRQGLDKVTRPLVAAITAAHTPPEDRKMKYAVCVIQDFDNLGQCIGWLYPTKDRWYLVDKASRYTWPRDTDAIKWCKYLAALSKQNCPSARVCLVRI